MDHDLLLLTAQGLLIGFSLAAPVGPLGLLCIQRTLRFGFTVGLLTGVGVALADAVYGLIAAFGFAIVSDFLLLHRSLISMGGGLFLGWLGAKTLMNYQAHPHAAHEKKGSGWWNALLSAFLLTLSNPMTIMAYVAIFSSTSIAAEGASHEAAFLMTLAIFSGSLAWWAILSSIVAATKHRLKQKHLSGINIASGLVLIGFGIFAIATALR
jgi:threonine/homoserine/homoserine lactone efflux protein